MNDSSNQICAFGGVWDGGRRHEIGSEISVFCGLWRHLHSCTTTGCVTADFPDRRFAGETCLSSRISWNANPFVTFEFAGYRLENRPYDYGHISGLSDDVSGRIRYAHKLVVDDIQVDDDNGLDDNDLRSQLFPQLIVATLDGPFARRANHDIGVALIAVRATEDNE